MKTIFIPMLLFLFACGQATDQNFSRNDMLTLVKALDAQFSTGVRGKDSLMLVNIYSENARYVQPDRPIIIGKEEIGRDWAGFLRLKEHPVDLILDITDVGGSRETIYEVGTGYTLLADSTRWRFNYVNVWQRQKNGEYKLEVDTYTPLN